jgi:hypothetical protein
MNTINDLLYGQQQADTQTNANIVNQATAQATASTTSFNAAMSSLKTFFTHGGTLSGSGGSDTNLSLSDAISQFMSPKNGTNGQTNTSLLNTLISGFTNPQTPGTVSGGNMANSPLSSYLSTLSNGAGSGSTT